ncbi:hypothetical protein HOY82DRAFT_598398 [Tuber indicum]|nr:hypothetical protein HOY82DRAFT_598398 [Tuber indicum]
MENSVVRRAEESVGMRLVEEEVEEAEEDIMERLGEISKDVMVGEINKDYLVGIVKRDWNTYHMNLIDLQRTAGYGHVCSSTILKASREHFQYCQLLKYWRPEVAWAMYGFTNEMSIEIVETEKDRRKAREQVALLNKNATNEEARLNSEWKVSEEWATLQLPSWELVSARILLRQAAKDTNTKAPKATMIYLGKKCKLKKIEKGEGRGTDS